MKKYFLIYTILSLLACELGKNSISTNESLYYPVAIIKYKQAPGYYSNNSAFAIKDNLDNILDFPIGGGIIAPNNDSLITLGEAGGYVVVEFDPPILNSVTDDGYDFIVYGNSFYYGGDSNLPNMEPGFVEVSSDNNTWYLLAPESNRDKISPVAVAYNRSDYTDSFWPVEERSDSITLTTWESTNYSEILGYCEITPTLEKPDNQDNITFYANKDIRGGGDPFKLEWAVDSNMNPVELDQISYIRITTGVYTDNDFGSQTEIDSIIRVNYE